MFDRPDTDTRAEVVEAAREEAQALGSATIEAEHLLLALAGDRDGPTGRLLADCGLARDGVLEALERESARSLAAVGVDIHDVAPSSASSSPRLRPRLAASSKRALEWGLRTAIARNDLGSGHRTSCSGSCAPASEPCRAHWRWPTSIGSTSRRAPSVCWISTRTAAARAVARAAVIRCARGVDCYPAGTTSDVTLSPCWWV